MDYQFLISCHLVCLNPTADSSPNGSDMWYKFSKFRVKTSIVAILN